MKWRSHAGIFPFGKMKIDSPSDLGKAVRAARRAAGVRQQDLAGVAGVGERFIVELEAGKPGIQLGKALQVIAALGHRLSIDVEP